ncbi:MAG: hypothetical protein PSV23_01530 [Brevundimonas sp.]|uniref:hypothetical protein n=1 Tax=Brevundimonas sp. TaxID=1871086 RepID=UPI002487AAA1|nr:hypothetical protein [Brevundimonas sp.]MDI1325456.1 hypothetical protein [Brevundimonas sp.]
MEIAIAGSLESPVITFSKHGGDRPERVCLGRLYVYESDAPAPRSPVWEIGDLETECAKVTSVTYGRAPGGIPTSAGPVPLKANTEYEFSGTGWTGRLPNVPWYGEGPGARVIFANGGWRRAQLTAR